MKRSACVCLLCVLLALGLLAAPRGSARVVPEEDPNRIELVVSPFDKKEKTVTVEIRTPKGRPATLRYGSLGGQVWLLVIGDPLTRSDRKLNLVGSTPLLAIHRDDAAKLISGEPLEQKMTLYAKKSRLPKQDSQEDYLYVWLIGTRVARALEDEETLPWSNNANTVPLLVNIKNFDHEHDQQDKGKVTLGKGSVLVGESEMEVPGESPFIMKDSGQYLVLLTDEEGHRDFAVVSLDVYTRPKRVKHPERDESDYVPPESEPDYFKNLTPFEPPNDGWGW